jgi:hypothetical protein
VPSSSVQYIGYTISSTEHKVIVKAQSKRIAKLKRSIRKVLSRQYVSARDLAKVLGQCVSVAWAVTLGKLCLRKSYGLLASKLSWSDILTLTHGVIEELELWLQAVDYWNYKEVCTETIQAQVVTDASHLGWGAVYQDKVASGDWNTRVSCLTSNEREMLAILMAIQAFGRL